ncbi:MAG: L-aspartate oxidase [Chitinophagales bacterium]|nr:L-aspartate oxidase [Chitinophagales bacterium]MDW8427183.1 L-aspartate oxidase [Chitinophagales bacterium]
MKDSYDFLVIGSGIAGLTYALKVSEYGSVCVVTKGSEDESNTKYAQGGVAAVWDFSEDSYHKHVADTLDAGDGLCKRRVVELVVKEGPERVREVIAWGARFDRNASGEYDLGREGGHSVPRVLHHKDQTGYEIERTLLHQIAQRRNIDLLTHHFAIDLLTQHHLGATVTRRTKNITCYGAYVLNTRTQRIHTLRARITLVATGGAGQVYRNTTNPLIATGDGIAMVYRAKGRVENMEFYQFHPTALYQPGQNPAFLISEAVRGFGAVLRTRDGKEFMHRYDRRKSLAPRDIVARAIDNEMKRRGDDYVFLDCRHLNVHQFKKHFPTIYKKCKDAGINIAHDMIPVVPAAHYLCGGIKTDIYGQTSIRNLYACGECASTGLHGANRLASNSLLEALVFAHRAFRHSVQRFPDVPLQEGIPDWNAEGTLNAEELVLITFTRQEVQNIMSNYVGIVRSNLRLKRALERLELIYRETEALYQRTVVTVELCELRNLINVAYLIIRSSMLRKESRGLNYNLDYPFKKKVARPTIL